MRSSNFIIMHQSADGVYVNQHGPTYREYGPPPVAVSTVRVANAGFIASSNTMFAEFYRPLDGINVEQQDIVWAYNPANTLNFRGQYFKWHGYNDGPWPTHVCLK